MRRRALPNALGALGQRTERRMPSLVTQLSRDNSAATVPLNPSRANLARGSKIGEDSSARLRVSARLAEYVMRASPGMIPRFPSHALIQSAKSAIRGS